MNTKLIALGFILSSTLVSAHDAIKDGKVIDKDVVLNRANFLRAYPELGLNPAECTNPVFYENDVDRDGDYVNYRGDEMCYDPCEMKPEPEDDIVVGGVGAGSDKPTAYLCN